MMRDLPVKRKTCHSWRRKMSGGCRLMLDEKIYLKKGMTFGCVCRIIGVSPEDLDEVVIREMGMSGQSLMDAYRISSKRGRVVTSE